MIASGWVNEVRDLMDEGYSLDLPSMSSLGYQELGSYLNGIIELPEAIRVIKNKTHRFARQQYAWFKKDDSRIRWFNASALEETREFVTQIVG
jgi:tRNA dimethylallyltransferase